MALGTRYSTVNVLFTNPTQLFIVKVCDVPSFFLPFYVPPSVTLECSFLLFRSCLFCQIEFFIMVYKTTTVLPSVSTNIFGSVTCYCTPAYQRTNPTHFRHMTKCCQKSNTTKYTGFKFRSIYKFGLITMLILKVLLLTVIIIITTMATGLDLTKKFNLEAIIFFSLNLILYHVINTWLLFLIPNLEVSGSNRKI